MPKLSRIFFIEFSRKVKDQVMIEIKAESFFCCQNGWKKRHYASLEIPTVLPDLDERRNMTNETSSRNGFYSNARNYGSGFGKGRNQGPRGIKRYSRDNDNQMTDRKRAKFGTSY